MLGLHARGARRRVSQRYAAAIVAAIALSLSGGRLEAQTDYYNTDKGRPVRVEDAYAVERYAFELQATPLLLERADVGTYTWALEPELVYGALARTHFGLGFPLQLSNGREGERRAGLTGIDIGVFHNLNAETRGMPALALAADVLIPVGNLAPEQTYSTLKAIGTRTFQFARFHLNTQYTFGNAPGLDQNVGNESRWMAGAAIDRTFPLRAALITGDVFVEQPLEEDADLRWTAEAGARYQLSPFFALDAGIGRRLTGADKAWFVTFGAARSFAIRSLFAMPPQ